MPRKSLSEERITFIRESVSKGIPYVNYPPLRRSGGLKKP